MPNRKEKAIAAANSYNQGHIEGLDDSLTRRLIASVVLTESNGGDLDITNSLGYVGRYQAGAGWLADAGYIDVEKLRAAMAKDGYTREAAWGAKGHMTAFLHNAANWKNGLSLDQYKASAELQDKAFKTICDKAYVQAIAQGVLTGNDNATKVAGYLKARHISGSVGARKALNGISVSDDYQTSNIKYLEDITRNGDGLDQLIGHEFVPSHQVRVKFRPANVMRVGAQSNAVETLQSDLAALGYTDRHGHPLRNDGYYGPKTEVAVRAFQDDHGLHVDGSAGPCTLRAIQGQRALAHASSHKPAGGPVSHEAQSETKLTPSQRLTRMIEAAKSDKWLSVKQDLEVLADRPAARHMMERARETVAMQDKLAMQQQHQNEIQKLQQTMQQQPANSHGMSR